MATNNPWMGMLAQILPTESFIIAGTTLNEIDLEYYLSFRTDATPRKNRGPSLLIEPNPDPATEADCERHGLILVKATFGDFLLWLTREFSSPPSLADLSIPQRQQIFPASLGNNKLLRFFNDFQLVEPGETQRASVPSPFLYGRAPVKTDLDQNLDIVRSDTTVILTALNDALASAHSRSQPRLILVLDQAGSGKTTLLKRLSYEISRSGTPVFALHALSKIDVQVVVECIEAASTKIVLLVDGIADHAEQFQEILQSERLKESVVVLASERSYRRQHVELILSDIPHQVIKPEGLSRPELRQLIELYREFGLVGSADALKAPDRYAGYLRGDPIAVAVCRILNDFRPLQAIIESLWEATNVDARIVFLCAALAKHCHASGIRYTALQAIAGGKKSIDMLFSKDVPLGLSLNPESDDYVVPLNASIAEAILLWRAAVDAEGMLEAFRLISSKIAVYVNRLAIMMRAPEARLAGRLFDADKIVKPLLGKKAERLFEACQRDWAWNSRYWEQRALLVADNDIDTALQYARHAVAIENHPFPLTTLGKLLLRKMETTTSSTGAHFAEAVNVLDRAISSEGKRARIAVHPFSTLFSGTIRYLELGGHLTAQETKIIGDHLADAEYWFHDDPAIRSELNRLTELIRTD